MASNVEIVDAVSEAITVSSAPPLIDSDTLKPSTAGTSRVRNWASSWLLPSFSDSSQPFSPRR